MLFFLLFVLFIALLVGPVVAGPKINLMKIGDSLPSIAKNSTLYQPTQWNNNDTLGSSVTGSVIHPANTAAAAVGAGGGSATTAVPAVPGGKRAAISGYMEW